MRQKTRSLIDVEAKLRSKKWPHPETGNKVEFSSLPPEEQAKLRAQAMAAAEKEEDKGGETSESEEQSPDDLEQELSEQKDQHTVELSEKDQKLYDKLLQEPAAKGSVKERLQGSLKRLQDLLPADVMRPLQRYILQRELEKSDAEAAKSKEEKDAAVEKALQEMKGRFQKGMADALEKDGVDASEMSLGEIREKFEDAKTRQEFAEAFINDAPPDVQKMGPPSFLKFMLMHILESMFEWAGKPEGHESAMEKLKRYEEYSKEFDKSKTLAQEAEQELKLAEKDLDALGKRPTVGKEPPDPGREPQRGTPEWDTWAKASDALKSWEKQVQKQEKWDEKKDAVLEKKKALNEHMRNLLEMTEDQQIGPGEKLEQRKIEREKQEKERSIAKKEQELPFKTVSELLRSLEKAQEELRKEAEQEHAEDLPEDVVSEEAGESKTEKAPEEETEIATPESEEAARSVAKKYELGQDVVEALRLFKRQLEKKPAEEGSSEKKEPPQTDAQKMQEFMRNADPDMKKRMKNMTPKEFMAMLAVISGEESKPETLRFARYLRSDWIRWAEDVDALGTSDTKGLTQFYEHIQEGLMEPSDEVLAATLESMTEEAEKSQKKASQALERLWFRLSASRGGPTAEGYFFDNPEKREVREFAQAHTLSNSTRKERTQGAPPTVREIEKKPGGKAVSTLNRYVIQTELPVPASVPQDRAEIPKHPILAARQRLTQRGRV